MRELQVGVYIADFVCREKRVVVEVDGGHHAEEVVIAYDNLRTRYFESSGYGVLRVWNNEVMENIEGVLEMILMRLESGGP